MAEDRLAKLEKKVAELEERIKHLEYHAHVAESHGRAPNSCGDQMRSGAKVARAHAFLGLASFVSGTVLVALLILDRAIPGRTRLLAKIVPTFWVLTLVVGAFFYVILHVI